jgi:dipeptidyl aminopeptidase/acylaminoacyl peptidase
MRGIIGSALLAAMAFVPAAGTSQTPAASAPAAPVLRPIADFATLPFMDGPQLSPDGTMVAARIATGGKQVLAIVPMFKNSAKQPAAIGLGENELLSWTWVNDGWLTIRIGNAQKVEAEDFYVTRVAGVSADGKIFKPIAWQDGGQSSDVIWTARDGSPRILITRQKSIYLEEGFWPGVEEVDISTGRKRPIVGGQEGVMGWYADASGAVRMGIGYNDDSRTSRLLYRSTGKGSFRTIDRADRRRDQSLTIPYLVTGETTRSLTVSGHEGFDALYELDLPGLTIGKKVFGFDGYDIDGAQLTADGSALAGIYYRSDRPHVKWIDPVLAETQALLDKAVGTRTATIISMNRDQTKMLVQVGDASQAGSIYYYDTAVGTMNLFAHLSASLKFTRLSPVSTYRYKARDGLSIEAVLTLPKGRDASNLPLILMPHGGPEARDTASYDWWAQFLADRGYAVVQPNYRGSTGYGEKFLNAGDGQWGLKMQDDLNDAVADLAAKGMIDPKRVCIVGASYGGYAALRGAQRDGSAFRCAVSYAGVADLNGMIRYDGKFLNANASKAGWQKVAPDLKDVSPINHAAMFSTPVLLMHGKKDLRVPVSQSRRMAERLKAAGKSFEYVEQPEGDHHFTREADRTQFLQVLESFLKKHNPA